MQLHELLTQMFSSQEPQVTFDMCFAVQVTVESFSVLSLKII